MRLMPDVTSDTRTDSPSTLKSVGMEDIAVPIKLKNQFGQLQSVPAKANVYVSLDSPETKGIHMSRIHLLINELADMECSQANLAGLLGDMISSQEGISQSARLELSFDLLLEKPSLLSGESGFQTYPVKVLVSKDAQGFECKFELTIPYSSTCPCSASLVRQLYATAINEQFPDATINKTDLLRWAESLDGSVATPHSQRSFAYIQFSLVGSAWPELPEMIIDFEATLGTPLQTAVKRQDEQEFARLNATNLMFCEDAARRLKQRLRQSDFVQDYWFKVEHQESLHAHNAVAIDHS